MRTYALTYDGADLSDFVSAIYATGAGAILGVNGYGGLGYICLPGQGCILGADAYGFLNPGMSISEVHSIYNIRGDGGVLNLIMEGLFLLADSANPYPQIPVSGEVPEPATMVLLGLGLSALALLLKRQ